jgi:hypothetical protein
VRIKTLQEKYESGDSLTDAELAELLKFYDNLIRALDEGSLPKYRLMQQDAWHVQDILYGYQKARANKN